MIRESLLDVRLTVLGDRLSRIWMLLDTMLHLDPEDHYTEELRTAKLPVELHFLAPARSKAAPATAQKPHAPAQRSDA